MASTLVHDLPFVDISVERTLPDNIFLLHELQKAGPVAPQIVEVKRRERNGTGDLPADDLEVQGIGYDVDAVRDVNRDREYTPDEFDGLLVQLQDKFIHPLQTLGAVELKEHIIRLWELHNFPDRPYELHDIQSGYKKNLYQVYRIYLLFVKYDMVGPQDADTIYNMNTFNRLLECIYQMNQLLTAEYNLTRTIDDREEPSDDSNLFRFTPQDYSKNSPFQNLLIFLLHTAYQQGYRLYRGQVCKQIYHEGFPTHSWKVECTVLAFVYNSIDKETNYEMWQNLTASKDNPKRAAEYLMSAQDKEFPTLKPDRHVWSFTDGVYDAKTMHFYRYESEPLPSTVVAIKFFERAFRPDILFSYEDWYDIPTPDFQRIMDYQELKRETCEVIYMMMGRCLYYVGEMDTWEVIMFIKGVAGSGKSTIGKILKYMYPSDDVAILSSNIERKFGLGPVHDRLLFLCLEVKRNFGLDQGDFQSMISGEEVSVAIKHKDARSVVWTVPGMLMGNEVAEAWVDAAGSMTRRVLLADFKKRVRATDTSLQSKLKQSVPALLHKINMAYQSAVKAIQSSSIWEVVPAYFKEQQKKFSKAINPLEEFLDVKVGDDLEESPDKFMPYGDFQNMYMRWLKSAGITKQHFGEDHYRTIFENRGYVVTAKEEKMYRGVLKRVSWIRGITEVEDNEFVADG